MLEAAEQAQSAAAQLDGRAQQVQSQTGARGFRGVAERIGSARTRLDRVREMQAGVVTAVKNAAEMVQRVTADMSPADVVSTLSPAAQQISSASGAASATTAELDTLKAEIGAALRGGKPGPLVALANQVKQAMVRVVDGLGAAKEAAEKTITAAQQCGQLHDPPYPGRHNVDLHTGAKRGGTTRPKSATLDAMRRTTSRMTVTVSRFAPHRLPEWPLPGTKLSTGQSPGRGASSVRT